MHVSIIWFVKFSPCECKRYQLHLTQRSGSEWCRLIQTKKTANAPSVLWAAICALSRRSIAGQIFAAAASKLAVPSKITITAIYKPPDDINDGMCTVCNRFQSLNRTSTRQSSRRAFHLFANIITFPIALPANIVAVFVPTTSGGVALRLGQLVNQFCAQ